MSTQPTNASQQAVTYAQNIGLDTVWEEARAAEETLREAHGEITKLADNKRHVEELILDREAAVVSEQRAANAEMTATEFERRIKGWMRDDPELKTLRNQRVDLSLTHDEAEYKVKLAEATIRIRSARMIELGGYFEYLAAVRTASIQAEKSTQ